MNRFPLFLCLLAMVPLPLHCQNLDFLINGGAKDSQRTLVGRGRAIPPSKGDQVGDVEPETTTPVAILKQINEHNEDGSYTYGYEAADGSFKLETRYPDGLVQGKYGYIDIDTGEVKVIEYGADMLGFQPVGDLPDGIVIPKPVFNNFTEGEENADDGSFQEEQQESPRVRVENRARVVAQQRQQTPPNQNRGQELELPVTPTPQPRRPVFTRHQQVAQTPPPVRLIPQPEPVAQPKSFHTDPYQTSFGVNPVRVSAPTRPTPAPRRSQPVAPVRSPVPVRDEPEPVQINRSRVRRPIGRNRVSPRRTTVEVVEEEEPQEEDPISTLRAIAKNEGRTRSRASPRSRNNEIPRSRPNLRSRPKPVENTDSSSSPSRFASFPARTTSSSSRVSSISSSRQTEPVRTSTPQRATRIRTHNENIEPERPESVPQVLPPRPQSRPRFQPPIRPKATSVDFDALLQEFTGRPRVANPVPVPSFQPTQNFNSVPAVPGAVNANGASFSLTTGFN